MLEFCMRKIDCSRYCFQTNVLLWCKKIYLRDSFLHTNFVLGVFQLVRVKKFPKSLHFLPPDTYTYVCVSGGKGY